MSSRGRIRTRLLDAVEPTERSFAPYGRVLESHAPGFVSLFSVSEAVGWQVAINTVVDEVAASVHRHPATYECFAPLAGRVAMLVAPADDPEALRAFLLTKAVCISPGVWHCAVAPAGAGQLFICEDALVAGEAVHLAGPVRVRP